ncbi:hypothetical protein [Streptomyces hainanensis]|uniref:Uncharacterized protein n=1 Tax=Streptomyces hainanensis TaxID=402648 RepID=A0A4R4SLV5_9ACTN|nr:hypothetical protein [Streptomyces hainanensis]TDC63072.1 hypothetical protein E1283_32980 [Streptomyces hainanensis]
MRAGRALRAARAAVFAALCVLLAAWVHVMMSGVAVAGWALSSALAGVGGGAWLFAGRERGPVAVMGATLAVQAALHVLFSAGRADAATAPTDPHTVAPHDALRLVTQAGFDPHAAHLPHTAQELGGGVGMQTAHVLVALASAVWLWRGERAVFGLLRRAASGVLRPVLCPPSRSTPPEPPAVPCPLGADRPPCLPPPIHAVWTRGPPPGALPGRSAPDRPRPSTPVSPTRHRPGSARRRAAAHGAPGATGPRPAIRSCGGPTRPTARDGGDGLPRPGLNRCHGRTTPD